MEPDNLDAWDWKHIKEKMKEGVVLVTFTKVTTGEVREMQCTLADYLLPQTNPNNEPSPKEDIFVCYDIENEGWRAFYKSRVLDVEVL